MAKRGPDHNPDVPSPALCWRKEPMRRLILAAPLLLAACVAPPEPSTKFSEVTAGNCTGQSISTLGIEDGMNGFGPDIRGARLATCRAVGVDPDESRYAEAYAEGAARYCGIENALRLGRQGIAILRQCPADQQAGFDDSYATGLAQRHVIAPLPHIGIGTGAGPSGQRRKIGPGLML
jgi:hypothetical protein